MEPLLLGVAQPEPEHGGDRLPEAPALVEVADADPDVIDRGLAALPEAATGLGAVAVGVEQEGAVVVRVVLRSQPGLSVAREAGLDPTPPERIDLVVRRSRERDVQVACERVVLI